MTARIGHSDNCTAAVFALFRTVVSLFSCRDVHACKLLIIRCFPKGVLSPCKRWPFAV